MHNILAILELVFDEPTVVAAAAAEAQEAEAFAAAATVAAAAPKISKSRKERMSSGPAGGFGASEVFAQHTTTQAVETLLDLGNLEGAEAYSSQSPIIIAYVRQRYGNHAKTVLEIIALWESYGEVYHAWRDTWTSDTDAYRAARALQFARAARDYAKYLAMVSKYKHKSWYVHMICWVVWRQLFERGNTWYHSTCSIESRGARIKRIGRRLTNWRPLVEG